MKEHWKTALVALAIFIAGLGTGIFSQHLHPRPVGIAPGEPPGPRLHVMREFRGADVLMQAPQPFNVPLPPPQNADVEAYEKKLAEITVSYREKIRSFLDDSQKAKFDEIAEPAEPPPHKLAGPPPPLPPIPHGEGRRDVLFVRTAPSGGELRFVGMIIFRPILDHLTEQLKLSDEQRAGIEKTMRERRDAVVQFVDANPPPTVRFTLKAE